MNGKTILTPLLKGLRTIAITIVVILALAWLFGQISGDKSWLYFGSAVRLLGGVLFGMTFLVMLNGRKADVRVGHHVHTYFIEEAGDPTLSKVLSTNLLLLLASALAFLIGTWVINTLGQ
jgi:hypothetical protein